jgi:hypothetical protein
VAVTANSLTTGNGLAVTSTGVIVTTGTLATFTANSATTSVGLVSVSGTGLTSGVALLVTGGSTNQLTTGSIVSIVAGASTVGAAIKVVTTGIYTDVSSALVNITASSATTGIIVGVLTTSSKALVVGTSFTNPVFVVDASTASAIAGLSVKGAVSGGTVALAAIDSGSNTNMSINGKGSGTLLLGNVSTGQISIGRGSVSAPILSNTTTALGTTQNSTPTAAQLLGGIVTQTSATGAGTVTLPTGTQLSTAVPGVAVGDTFTVTFANLGGGQTLTITGASGSTVLGNATVPSAKFATLVFTNTGSNAWSVYCVVSA